MIGKRIKQFKYICRTILITNKSLLFRLFQRIQDHLSVPKKTFI